MKSENKISIGNVTKKHVSKLWKVIALDGLDFWIFLFNLSDGRFKIESIFFKSYFTSSFWIRLLLCFPEPTQNIWFGSGFSISTTWL